MRSVERDSVQRKRPSILILNAFPGEGMGGGEVQTLHLIRGLTQRGVPVHLACPSSQLAEEARAAGAVVHERAFGAGDLVCGHLDVRRLVSQTDCDVVHGTGFLTNIVARRVKRGSEPAVVNTVHVVPGASLYQSGSRAETLARRLIDRMTLSKVDALVAVSEAVAEGLRQARLVPRSGVRVIHNGIDVDDIVSRADAEVAGLPSGTGPLVGFLGRLERVKGPDLFASASVELAKRRADVRFAVAGFGSMAEEIRSAMSGFDAERTAVLGRVSNAAAFLRCLDVVVIPSRSESFSLVALEAMAVGTPIVATAVGGLAVVIRESGAGILVPPNDPRALADAVEALLNDPALAGRLRDSGRTYARRFSVDRMVDAYLALYESLVSGASR